MKTAVVLMNLGGPDSTRAIRPFLFNLFSDKAIIGIPQPFRWLLAQLLSRKRAPVAKEIYDKMGGKSPLLEETQKQAAALQSALGNNYSVHIAMRYWHPMTKETVEQVKQSGADKIILLPLYPQYSTTSTASSLHAWHKESKRQGLKAQTEKVCCYPVQSEFIQAHAELIRPIFEEANKHGKPRIIFSAHGVPQKVIDDGDPYRWQIEQTAQAIVKQLAISDLDFIVSFQSRVGPLEWTKPYTEQVVKETAQSKTPIVMVPIGFVSEHSETLVELDMDYKSLAERSGSQGYFRVPALRTNPVFIQALKTLCETAADAKKHNSCSSQCKNKFSRCGGNNE